MTKNKTPSFSFVEKFKNFLYGDEDRPFGKPRRIIQNQALIQFLFIMATLSPAWCILPIFYLVFGVCPSIIVPFLIVLWAVSAIVYIALDLLIYFRIKGEK
jgi:hypothetical protein